jgi:hypothetical protein
MIRKMKMLTIGLIVLIIKSGGEDPGLPSGTRIPRISNKK